MASDDADIRCDCGRLLARRVRGDVIEIKCRRCGRTVSIKLDVLTEDGDFVAAEPERD